MKNMSVKIKMLEYFRLLRLQTAAATATAPLLGALVIGQRDLLSLAILFFIGMLYHIYGFVLNEYIDIEVDKKSAHLQKKPLVSGIIKKETALFITVGAIVIACILIIVFFPALFPISLFLLALVLGGVYDLFGKKIPGCDFILGGGFFFLCLFGVSTVSTNFTLPSYIVCSVYFFHIVFNNAVEGGLKDVEHDYLAGAKTLAIAMRVKVKKGRIGASNLFIAFAYGLEIIFLGFIIYLVLQPEIKLSYTNTPTLPIILVFLFLIFFITSYRFLHMRTMERGKLKRFFSVHEMISFFILLMALYPLLGLWITVILLLLPSVWYLIFNIILYGKLLQPQV